MVAAHNNNNSNSSELDNRDEATPLKLPLKVRASSSARALAKITQKLGEDAIVLATRTIRDPDTNKRMVEVEATIEMQNKQSNNPVLLRLPTSQKRATPAKKPPLFKQSGITAAANEPPAPANNSDSTIEILSELREMRTDLHNYGEKFEAANFEVQTLRKELREVEIAVSNLTSEHAIIREHGIPGEWVPSYRRLVAASIDPSIAEEIIEDTIETSDSTSDSEIDSHETLVAAVAKRINVKPLLNEAVPPPVISVTGPAGAGKTSMVAKIAAHAVLKGTASVGIICCETAGSFETLSKVAGALGTPILCASKDSGSLSRAVFTMQQENVDFVLIDTPPISASNRETNKVLWGELKSITGNEILAVLPATMRDIDLNRACKVLSRLGFHRLAFTQMDEALRSGSILSAITSTGLPLAALSYGTKMPDDFVLPNPMELARRIVRPPRVEIVRGSNDG